MTPTQARRKVQAILQYCSDREMSARLHHDQWQQRHWEECYVVVFDAFYGAEPPSWKWRPVLAPVSLVQQQIKAARPKAPDLRPLRRISQRVMVRYKSTRDGYQHSYVVQRLECGHRLQEVTPEVGTRPAKRRRCGECLAAGNSKPWYTPKAVAA